MKTLTSEIGSNSAQQGFTFLSRSAQQGFTCSSRSAQQGFTFLSRSVQQGFTCLPRFAQQGFTLIELMVVIAIMGVMAAAVIFNLPDPRGRLIDEGETFAARVLAVRDEAIMTARETRVRVTLQGYAFDQRRREGWLAITGKPLGPAQWQPGTGATPSDTVFDPTGMADEAARIYLMRDGVQLAVDIAVDGSIRVGR